MRYHYTLGPGLDTMSERHKFQGFQPFEGMGNRGKRQVRIYSGITMTGEML